MTDRPRDRPPAEAWFFELRGYLLLKGVMDAPWLAAANGAVRARPGRLCALRLYQFSAVKSALERSAGGLNRSKPVRRRRARPRAHPAGPAAGGSATLKEQQLWSYASLSALGWILARNERPAPRARLVPEACLRTNGHSVRGSDGGPCGISPPPFLVRMENLHRCNTLIVKR